MRTLLSSLYQLRLGVRLSHLSYILTLELNFTSRVPSVLDLAHLNSHNFFDPRLVVITITSHLHT